MIAAILFAMLLLIIGFTLRVTLRPLQWIFVPASIVGGLVGLLVIQATDSTDSAVIEQFRSWPGILIAVVFAGMLLERESKSWSKSLRLAGREGLLVWIIVLGQTAAGLLCTWLIIQPFVEVPNSFGMLIETGFAGGHGTAAAMGDVFASPSIGLQNGRDLGLFMATVGLVFSVVSGVIYVNIAIRRGWTSQSNAVSLIKGIEDQDTNQPAAYSRVRMEVLDPLAFQALILGAAFGLGWSAKQGVSWLVTPPPQTSESVESNPSLVSSSDSNSSESSLGESAKEVDRARDTLQSRTSWRNTVDGMPLFIYTLFGGLAVRRFLGWLGLEKLIDVDSIQRLTGVAMEFLIVAAIASLQIEAISDLVGPLLVLLSAAFIWTGFCLTFLSKRILPDAYWFELGILNYGMSTGTTATGFTLLKIVDGELDSGAAEDYALAAPLSSPFVGGGMVTVGLPLLVLERIPIGVTATGLTLVVVGLSLFACWWKRREQAD